jgi:hypothetical protein
MLLIPKGQMGKAGNLSKSSVLTEIADRKVFSLFFVFEGLTSMFYNFWAWRPKGWS